MDDEPSERPLSIHIEPAQLAGVYANYASVAFSDYEFTVTFATVEHEGDEGDVTGAVVSRINVSHRFMRELIDALEDAWSKWESRENIRRLPEVPPRPDES